LHALKAQWFTLFDCYADLQHDILHKRRITIMLWIPLASFSSMGWEITTTVTGNQKPRLFCASITGISGTMGVE
jgi:hypothetical protein